MLEYKKGRILNDCKSERHSAACQKNKQRIREEKKESSDNEEKDPAVIHPVEKQTRKRANDGASHPTSKRLRTSSVRTQKEEGEEPAAKSQILEASIGTSEDKTKGRRSSRSANLQARRPVSNLPSIQSARRNLVTPMMQKQEDETESEVEDNSNDKLEITWESCLNPWGRESSLEEDVVVFSSAKGIGESERMLPSARFEMHPFSGGSRYQNTHHSPEEGFQAIVLQRDTLENSSWGFTVCRHDFGGACLVSSVVPFSPADTAVSERARRINLT